MCCKMNITISTLLEKLSLAFFLLRGQFFKITLMSLSTVNGIYLVVFWPIFLKYMYKNKSQTEIQIEN